MTEIVAGDSYWKDFTSVQVDSFDAAWSASSWAIKNSVVDVTALASGPIAPSQDASCMELRIGSASTGLDPGTEGKEYALILQFKNSTTGFCKTLQEIIKILP